MSDVIDPKLQRENNIKLFDVAADVRKFEVTLFWQRSVFFWGLIAATFVGYASLKDDASLRFLVACFGVICSLAWALAARGSKYWYEAWEQKVADAELRAFGTDMFTELRPVHAHGVVWRARRFSVTRIVISLSDFTLFVWFLLAGSASPGWHISAWDYKSVLGLAITGVFVISIIRGGRSNTKPFPKTQRDRIDRQPSGPAI